MTEIIKIDDNLVIIGLAGKMPGFVKKGGATTKFTQWGDQPKRRGHLL